VHARASWRGRRAGLGGWQIAAQRRDIQARRTVSDESLAAWLRPSPTQGDILRLKRRIDRLASSEASAGQV